MKNLLLEARTILALGGKTMNLISEDYLMHHGVKGMKWGVRKRQPISMRGNIHRGLSKIYSINEKTYKKLGNNTLASMNADAKNQQLKKAEMADAKKAQKISNQLKNAKNKVDVSMAKNSTTKRVAEDYHNLTNREFRGKYKTTKSTFAKRYNKTGGDTYTLGRKKQALAIAFLGGMQGKSMARRAVDIAKYDTASRAEQKSIDKGHKYAAGAIKQATSYSMRKEFSNTYYMPEVARKKYHL